MQLSFFKLKLVFGHFKFSRNWQSRLEYLMVYYIKKTSWRTYGRLRNNLINVWKYFSLINTVWHIVVAIIVCWISVKYICLKFDLSGLVGIISTLFRSDNIKEPDYGSLWKRGTWCDRLRIIIGNNVITRWFLYFFCYVV